MVTMQPQSWHLGETAARELRSPSTHREQISAAWQVPAGPGLAQMEAAIPPPSPHQGYQVLLWLVAEDKVSSTDWTLPLDN